MTIPVAVGKHARPSKAAVVAGTATAGAVLAGSVVAVTPALAAPVTAPPPRPVTTAELEALVSAPPPVVQHYRVKPGDTLSGIAKRFCGSPARWQQLWQANRSRIKNPNLIFPDELVRLVCDAVATSTAPPDPRPSSSPAPTVTAAVTGAQGVIGSKAVAALKKLTRERTDQGVDFGGSGPLYAFGPGVIQGVYSSGWPGGVYIQEKLDTPLDGHGYVYVAEEIAPAVTFGERVADGQLLGTARGTGDGIEVGWASPVYSETLAHYDGEYSYPTADGQSFAAFIDSPSTGSTAGAGPRPPAPKPAAAPAFPALASRLSALGYDGASMAAVAQYLLAHGYTATAAAGVLGCIAGESAGNPESVGDGGGGLIGWTPLPGGFVTGNKARDLEVQVSALIAYDNANGSVSGLNAQPTASAAAWYYSEHFERPKVTGSDIRYEVVSAVYSALAG